MSRQRGRSASPRTRASRPRAAELTASVLVDRYASARPLRVEDPLARRRDANEERLDTAAAQRRERSARGRTVRVQVAEARRAHAAAAVRLKYVRCAASAHRAELRRAGRREARRRRLGDRDRVVEHRRHAAPVGDREEERHHPVRDRGDACGEVRQAAVEPPRRARARDRGGRGPPATARRASSGSRRR